MGGGLIKSPIPMFQRSYEGGENILREQWPRLTMGHLGSRTIASEMLERVSCGDQTTLSVGLPWETERMGAWSDPRVCEDSKTNRTFFIILHSLEEHPLQPNPFRSCSK